MGTASVESLIPQAVFSSRTQGRLRRDPYVGDDDPFELDRRRIIHCMAFRRLRHKTQVFVASYGDHFRTRLTHTLEVAGQAQRLARRLRLNERLAAAIALAHDLGHAPFGHAGEKELAEQMRDHGGFEHNRHSLRVVDYLEHPYPEFHGLNLTFELRESLIKHQTRYDRPEPAATKDPDLAELFAGGAAPPLEGQAANLADAIAYTLHDIEDGLVEGMLTEDALGASRLWREAAEPIRRAHPDALIHRVRRPILDRLAERIVNDAAAESARRIAEAGVGDVCDVRRCGRPLIALSEATDAALQELADLLFEAVYREPRVLGMDAKARRLVGELFACYLAEPRLLPKRYAARLQEQAPHRVICDYIAGMTDRFCQEQYRRLLAPFDFGG